MNVAIIGKNSYIGNSFFSYCLDENVFSVEKISSRCNDWEQMDFSTFSSVVCVVGIAHVSTHKIIESKYNAVNRDLPVAIAKKAKSSGVKQFIFLSSMIVFGDDKPINAMTHITNETKPEPKNIYGKSKLEAEKKLLQLADINFKILLIRVPMVYGEGCKGNFPKLISIATKLPFFPDINNNRSMIYIYNLCEFIKLSIINNASGVVYPQNIEYVQTKALIEFSRKYYGKNTKFIKTFNPLIIFMSYKIDFIRKVFGTKIYDKMLSKDIESYNVYTFEESIRRYLQNGRKCKYDPHF
jgi:UDP-glucose 4-epimerase